MTVRQTTRWRIVADALAAGLGRWGRLIVFVAIAAMAVGVFLGCASEEKRYQVLSFFFDGVPVPESLKDKYPPQQPAEDEDEDEGERRWRSVPLPEPPVEYVFHRPYMNRDCFVCHDREGGYEMVVSGTGLCQKCHTSYFQRQEGDWLHGPVIVGECRMCHEPHKSEYDGLLTAQQPMLCLQCHDPTFIETDPYHRRLDDLTCTNCHDPHAAGNRDLLADGRTYGRNRNATLRIGSKHPDWQQGECALCHKVDESMALVEDVNKECVKCHEKEVKGEGRWEGEGKLHKPVADGQCTTCHTPHTSPRPHLVRPLAETLCVDCHKIEELPKPEHPRVTHVDCTLCHDGHRSGREHLLRQGIGVSTEDDPPESGGDSPRIQDGTMPVQQERGPAS